VSPTRRTAAAYSSPNNDRRPRDRRTQSVSNADGVGAEDQIKRETKNQVGSDPRIFGWTFPLERNAEVIVGSPRYPASPAGMPVPEAQFKTVRHVGRILKADACSTVGEVNDGARERRPVHEDFGVLREPGAPDGSAVVHGAWTCWRKSCLSKPGTRSIVSSLVNSSVHRHQVLLASKSIEKDRVKSR
jgi:hypothetical protein